MPRKKAAILSTGSEILEGLYADENARWLAEQMSAAGLRVERIVSVGDEAESLGDALALLAERADLVVMSGGLGPTEDDLTRQAVCELYGLELELNEKAWKMIGQRFARRGRELPESNRVQAMLPAKARCLYNEWGTAPGFLLKGRGGLPTLAALPGPPREMRPMYRKHLEAELARRFGGGRRARAAMLQTFGIAESALNPLLRPIFEELRDDPDRRLGLLCGDGRVTVRVVARARNERQLRERLNQLVTRVRRRLPRDIIYGRDGQTLEECVGRLFRRRGLRLALAESCTGGLVAQRLTDVPGASRFFAESWVTYSNEAKHKRLGVKQSTLEQEGAVSPRAAREMARGALSRSGADVALAVTGIAGPGGGRPGKPVGTVYYGLAWRAGPGKTVVQDFHSCVGGERQLVRRWASHRALDLLRRHVLGIDYDLPG